MNKNLLTVENLEAVRLAALKLIGRSIDRTNSLDGDLLEAHRILANADVYYYITPEDIHNTMFTEEDTRGRN